MNSMENFDGGNREWPLPGNNYPAGWYKIFLIPFWNDLTGGNLLSENSDTKVSISVDSNDNPSIIVMNKSLLKKYRDVAAKLEVKDLFAAKDLVKNIYAQIQAKIKNPFIFKLADEIFDFKKNSYKHMS